MTWDQDSRSSRVLVALDGSRAAATALPVARMIASQLGAAVGILHVAERPLAEADVRRQLQRTGQDTEALDLLIRQGEPAAGILQAAADPRVGLLVLTTHGRSVEQGRHLGHVAEAVIAATIRPVLLIRPEAAAALGARRPELRRLLLPLDGTPTTASALQPATELACRLGASVDLLYVAAPKEPLPEETGSIGAPLYVDQPQHEWPHWAAEMIDRLCTGPAQCPAEVPVRLFLAQGDVGDEIERFATEHRVDAIVLVRRSHLEPGRARVLRAVLDRTPCPVLLVGAPVA